MSKVQYEPRLCVTGRFKIYMKLPDNCFYQPFHHSGQESFISRESCLTFIKNCIKGQRTKK